MRTYLKKIREEKGLTQQDMAAALGIKQNYYSMIESGQRQQQMTLDMVDKLSEVLDVPAETIIAHERERKAG